MATVTASYSLNMINPSVWYGNVLEATSSRIVISDGFESAIYSGTGFKYAGDYVIGGTLTGYQEYSGSQLMGQVTDIAIPATTAYAYIQSNDLGGLIRLAASGNDTIRGGIYSDALAGYEGDDSINGRDGDDLILAGAGDDVIRGGLGENSLDGGNGLDRAHYDGLRSDFTVRGGDIVTIAGNGINDELISVERVVFDHSTLAFDFDGAAGEGYRLYRAAFDRTPDVDGLSYWVEILDNGMSLHRAAEHFIGSKEFHSLYGDNPTNGDLVQLLYNNVLDRDPDEGGYDYWLGRMEHGLSQADMLIAFSESDENRAHVDAIVHDGIWLL